MGVLLECSGLTKRFGKREALKQVDLSVESGKIVGLLGPNGSGKTTLIKLANGLLRPDGGSIRIDGQEPGVYTKSIVSYLPDRMYFADWMRVSDMVRMFRDFYTDFRLETAEDMLEDASVILSTHLIADIEKVLDEVIFLKEGQVVRQDPVDRIREQEKKSVDALFREIFAVPMGAMDWDTHGREGER